jgi:hypothetical protein
MTGFFVFTKYHRTNELSATNYRCSNRFLQGPILGGRELLSSMPARLLSLLSFVWRLSFNGQPIGQHFSHRSARSFKSTKSTSSLPSRSADKSAPLLRQSWFCLSIFSVLFVVQKILKFAAGCCIIARYGFG